MLSIITFQVTGAPFGKIVKQTMYPGIFSCHSSDMGLKCIDLIRQHGTFGSMLFMLNILNI